MEGKRVDGVAVAPSFPCGPGGAVYACVNHFEGTVVGDGADGERERGMVLHVVDGSGVDVIGLAGADGFRGSGVVFHVPFLLLAVTEIGNMVKGVG